MLILPEMLNVLIRACLQQRMARVNRSIRREIAAEAKLHKEGRKEGRYRT